MAAPGAQAAPDPKKPKKGEAVTHTPRYVLSIDAKWGSPVPGDQLIGATFGLYDRDTKEVSNVKEVICNFDPDAFNGEPKEFWKLIERKDSWLFAYYKNRRANDNKKTAEEILGYLKQISMYCADICVSSDCIYHDLAHVNAFLRKHSDVKQGVQEIVNNGHYVRSEDIDTLLSPLLRARPDIKESGLYLANEKDGIDAVYKTLTNPDNVPRKKHIMYYDIGVIIGKWMYYDTLFNTGVDLRLPHVATLAP